MKIGRKLAIWIVLSAFIIALASAVIHYKISTKETISEFEDDGRNIARVVEISLTDVMLMGMDISVLNGTLDSLSKVNGIDGIWIIDTEGTAKAGSPEGVVGTKRPMKWDEAKGYYFEKGNVYHWVQPIHNRPPCHRCHGSKNKFNGAIMIDFSTVELQKHVRERITEGFTVALGTVGIIALLVVGLSRSLVTKRLDAIIEQVRHVRDGNYGASVAVKGNDEISELSEFFNEMADAVSSREKEKNLLFKQISRSYEMWQSTFDSITDLIAIIDDNFNIVMANKAFVNYFGVSWDELKSKKCHQIFHGSDSLPGGCPHLAAIEGDRPETMEYRQPGTDRILQLTVYPFHNPDIGFRGSIHVARDITEEKENEMRLIVSDRLAALGEMASGLAHEINNPLASIAGCTEGLMNRVKKGAYDPEFFREYLDIMAEEILRCKNITTNMLSFVRRTSAKHEADVNMILDRTVDIISLQGRLKSVETVREYGDSLPAIIANESELRQVFMAIITNALDAMKESGTLTLRTAAEGDKVVVEINDTGPGIPPEIMDRIFDPFFTTKAESGGTGLGLSIARKIIASNDGSMEAASPEGKGTTIKITLTAKPQE